MKATEMFKGADDARRLLRGFKALEDLANVLEQSGAAVQAKEEAETALADLRGQIAAAGDELEKAQTRVTAAKDEARLIVEAARSAADGIAADAGRKAESLRAQADADAAAAREAVAVEIAAAQANLRGMKDEATALAEEVKALEAKAEKARAYLAKLAG